MGRLSPEKESGEKLNRVWTASVWLYRYDSGEAEVLLAKRKAKPGSVEADRHSPPGGKLEGIDRGSLVECAMRETEEETGIVITPKDFEVILYEGGQDFKVSGESFFHRNFLVAWKPEMGEPQQGLDRDSHEDWEWIPISEVKQLIEDGLASALVSELVEAYEKWQNQCYEEQEVWMQEGGSREIRGPVLRKDVSVERLVANLF